MDVVRYGIGVDDLKRLARFESEHVRIVHASLLRDGDRSLRRVKFVLAEISL